MKRVLIWMTVLLISVMSVYGSLFTPRAPPSIVINNNTNLSVNYIETNQGGFFGGDVIINGTLIVINITVIGQINNVTILDVNVTNDMIVNGRLTVYGIFTGDNGTFNFLNVSNIIYANNFFYHNGQSINDTILWVNGTGITRLKSPQDIDMQEKKLNNVYNIVTVTETVTENLTVGEKFIDYSLTNINTINTTSTGLFVCGNDTSGSGTGADSLGNHTASQNINMTDYNITSVNSLIGKNESGFEFLPEGGIRFWLYK